jgi:hypothetical protein
MGDDSVQLPCAKPQLLANLGLDPLWAGRRQRTKKSGDLLTREIDISAPNDLFTQLFRTKKLKSFLAEAILNEFA